MFFQDSPLESCTSPSTIDTFSSSPVRTPRVDNSPGVKDGSELPSPFSVLERIYMEDIANPKNILAQTGRLKSRFILLIICFLSLNLY